MQHLEVSGAVRPLQWSLGVKWLISESFGLLNDLLLPFPSILDASCPIFYLHLANVLFDVILPSVLGSSLLSLGQEFPIKYLLNI